jgi:hypothetical protein
VEALLARFVGMVVIMAIAILLEPTRRASRNRTLGRIARLLGGRLQPGSASRTGGIVWNLEGAVFLLYEAFSGWGRSDGFVARLRRGGPTRLRLLPENAWTKLRKFFGARDVEVGNGDFDRAFLVQAENPEGARRFLLPTLRQALLELNAIERISVDLGPSELLIRTRERFLRDPDRLSRFAAQSLAVARVVLGSQAPVRIMEVDVNRGADCPGCGAPVGDDGGQCVRCRTPHHKDCWEYFGGCSVFACAGRPARMRQRRPRVRVRR